MLAAGVSGYAGTIHGTVTNMTENKISVGDKVTLLSLSAALEEVDHTTTDAKGQFKLTTPSDAPYLVKVEHEKGSYFKNVPPGTSEVAITVYDAASKVDGVSTEADVLRIESDSTVGQLKVTENYFVKNLSTPPKTQVNDKGYEVVIPADATLDGAATVGPSGMPTAATPDPVQPKGHYSFDFPIRPNEGENGTRFQLTYHIPYSGKYTFRPTLLRNAENVAIMVPKGMTFLPGTGTSYQPVPDDVTGQTFLMRGAKAGQPLEFTVSGEGVFPREAQNGGGAAGAQASDDGGQSGPGGKPGGGLGNPINTPDPLSKYKWWILSALGLVLVSAAAFLVGKPSGAPLAAAATPEKIAEPQIAAMSAVPLPSKRELLLDALKEEMFDIESERIAGKLSDAEYTEVKSALEIVLRRALGRK